MKRHGKASSAGSISSGGGERRGGRRVPVALLGALVLAIAVSLGAASAIADTPPSVTIDAPTEVSYTTAQVSGTVDPEGGPSATTWVFETSTDPSDPGKWEPQYSAYGEISGAEAEASDPVAVGGTVYLAPGTEYSVRLVAENEASANRSETGPPYPSFTTLAASPPTVTIDAPTDVAATSAHFSGTVNPEGSDPEASETFWRFECIPECPNLGEGSIGSGTSPEPVSVDAKGLQPNTAYEVSLIASNRLGQQAQAGPESFTTPAEAPFATTTGATVPVGGTSATVGGRVNPRNSATTYWVEYGTSDAYGQSAPPTEDASAGSGGETIAVSQALSGLTPQTTYHYRAVAKNATGTTVGQDLTFKTPPATAPPAASCPNQALRVGPSATLPDCRAYEQVSPQNKNESNASPKSFTADGEHMVMNGTGAFADAPRGGDSDYLGTRTLEGWQVRSLAEALPASIPNAIFPPTPRFNADASRVLFSTIEPLLPADTNHRVDLYLSRPDGSLEWITQPTASFPPGAYLATSFSRSTDDLSHNIFQQTSKLVPAAAGLDDYSYGLYEWANGSLRLVNVDSQEELLSPYGAGLGSGVIQHPTYINTHALSSDGERIFFTTPAYRGEVVPPPFDIRRISLREAGQTTIEISASQCTEVACEGPERDAIYLGAAADGSVAFFSSNAQLTNDATPGGGLYRYEVSSGELTLLAPGGKGVVGNSDDGSLVYFVSTGTLADGATLGSDNLYLLDAGTDTTTFIATLNPSDDGIWADAENSLHPAEVTPSGNNLVFRTAAPLAAGYDNAGLQQIYRYDAPAGELSCVSCVPTGTPAQSDVSFSETNLGPLKNNVSDDGSFVFFQTAAPLLSRDTNGKVDVYQWHDGTVSLISSGTSSSNSLFSGATPSGRDVAFSTWEPLVLRDNDEHMDAYDARINGGFQQRSTPEPTPCSGSGCRGNASGDPGLPSPASANFDGAEGSPGDRSGAFRVNAVSSSQAKKWAKTGLLSLRVRVPAAGRVKATASARLGKRSSTVASASAPARKAGMVSLALRLSKAARSYLDRNGRLPVTITVTHSKSKAGKRVQVTLIAQQAKQADRGQR